jgi:hypothetical protein
MISLQILDEGTITDSQGRKVDFKVCSICFFLGGGTIAIYGLVISPAEHYYLLNE